MNPTLPLSLTFLLAAVSTGCANPTIESELPIEKRESALDPVPAAQASPGIDVGALAPVAPVAPSATTPGTATTAQDETELGWRAEGTMAHVGFPRDAREVSIRISRGGMRHLCVHDRPQFGRGYTWPQEQCETFGAPLTEATLAEFKSNLAAFDKIPESKKFESIEKNKLETETKVPFERLDDYRLTIYSTVASTTTIYQKDLTTDKDSAPNTNPEELWYHKVAQSTLPEAKWLAQFGIEQYAAAKAFVQGRPFLAAVPIPQRFPLPAPGTAKLATCTAYHGAASIQKFTYVDGTRTYCWNQNAGGGFDDCTIMGDQPLSKDELATAQAKITELLAAPESYSSATGTSAGAMPTSTSVFAGRVIYSSSGGGVAGGGTSDRAHDGAAADWLIRQFTCHI
jgi:hypothetical protein